MGRSTFAALEQRVFTSTFWLLCAGTVLFMASFGMLLPELPGYLETYGAGHLIGWIVALFTVGAFFSRFFQAGSQTVPDGSRSCCSALL